MVDSRGGKQSARLRRSEVSTDDLTALGLGCQPCASAQGANPPPPTTQKALTFVSAFCVRVGRGVFQEPTGRALAHSDKPCGGLPLAGNRSKHPLPCSLPYYFKCIRVSLLRWRSGVVAQSTTINRWFVRNLRRAPPTGWKRQQPPLHALYIIINILSRRTLAQKRLASDGHLRHIFLIYCDLSYLSLP